MKRTIAFLTALTAVFSLFTGCGHDEGAETDSVSSSVSEKAEKAEDAAEDVAEEVTEAPEEDVTDGEDKAAADSSDEEQYIALMKDIYAAMGRGDINAVLKLSFPKAVYEPMEKIGAASEFLGMGFDADMTGDELAGIKVVSVSDPEDDIAETTEKVYSMIADIYGALADLGVTKDMLTGEEEMPEGKQEEIVEKMSSLYDLSTDDLADIKSTIKIDSYKVVVFEIDGEEHELAIYSVEGEDGLKMDTMIVSSMLGYVKKSKKASANSDSKSIFAAFNTALVDLDEQGINFDEAMLISSDKSRMINGGNSDKDIEKLIEEAESYIDFSELGEYMVLIADDVCCYVITEKNAIGTYPPNSVANGKDINETRTLEDSDTFDSIYKELAELVK